MSRVALVSTLTLVALLAFGVGLVSRLPVTDAQDAPPSAEEQQAAMKRWQDACTPGAAQERLARYIGSWDVELVMTMYGQRLASKGTAETKWLIDGRWLQIELHGTLMGRPLHSIRIFGFDNFKRKYVWSSVDSQTTTMLRAEGIYNPREDAFYTFGLLDEPLTMEHDKTVRYISRWDGKDTFREEVHDLDIGVKDTKVVEFVFTRQKS